MNDPAGHLCTPSPNNEFMLRLGFTFSGSVTCLDYPQSLAGGLSALPKELDEHRYAQM
jgi:hypothetical protein